MPMGFIYPRKWQRRVMEKRRRVERLVNAAVAAEPIAKESLTCPYCGRTAYLAEFQKMARFPRDAVRR
jgi:hypothetical protein